jgi:autotransporter-associated beta strand protein
MILAKLLRRFTNPVRSHHRHRAFQPALELLEDRTVFTIHLAITGLPAVITAGTPFDITVTAQNPDNSTYTAYTGSVNFTSSDGGATLPANNSSLPGGSAIFSVTLLKSGTQSITATDQGNSAITGTANPVVNAAATSQFLVTGLTSPTTAGVAGNITVTAADTYGNTTTGYTGTVHFTSSDVQAVLPTDHPLTGGTGTFSVTLKTAGTQSVIATDTVNANITGRVGDIPQTQAVYTQAPNPVGGGVKSAWYAPGGQGMDGDQYVWDSFVLGSNQAINEIHWRGFYAYAAYNSPNIPSCPVSDFTISIYPTSPYPGVNEPNIFAQPFVQYSTGGNAGQTPAGTVGGMPMYDYAYTLPTAFQAIANTKYWVQIEASQSVAPLTSWPPDWSLAFGTGGDNSYFLEIIGGTLAGGNQYTTHTGNDTAFSLVTYTNAPGVVVNPAAMSRLSVAGFASPTVAGTVGKVMVSAVDPYGNVTPSYAGTFHFTSSDPRAVLPGDATLINGVGTFDVTLETAGTQALTATDTVNSALHGSQSGITVSPANASSMTMVGYPSAMTVGTTHAMTITLWDAYGNVATGYTGTVAISSTDPQAALPATYTFASADKGTWTCSATLNTVGTWSLSAYDTRTTGLAANQPGIQVYPPITLGALSFAEWTASRAGYNATIAVGGGTGVYTGMSVTGLPAGLRTALSGSSITIGGTPTAAGTFTFTVSVIDSAHIGASQSYPITIEPSTTLAWTGLGGDNHWSNPANWTGAAPVAGSILDFGPGALQKTTVNDFAAGMLFGSILFEDSGYTLGGNAIRLSGGIKATNPVNGSDTVALNVGLTANQTFSIGATATLLMTGIMSGAGFGVTMAGAGTVVYGGSAANTYTGTTVVNGAELQLNNAVGNALAGPLTIGAGASVWYGIHGNQVSDSAKVTVGAGGSFDLNSQSDKIGSLVLNGGTVATGTGTLMLGGNITSNAAHVTAYISGELDLGGATRSVTVAHGTAAEDLIIDANVSNGGLTKSGAGALVLAGNNSYAGVTTVSAGVLDLQKASALGTTAGATTVAAGATLEIESNSVLSFADALTLAGGTLLMLGGSNTWAGNIAFTGASTVGVAAGTLTLAGVLSGSSAVTKVGAGTLVYGGSAPNTRTGPTTVSGGQLQLNDSAGNAIVGPLTVGARASVSYGSDHQVSDTATVTVGAGGTLDLNGHADKVAALVLNGGTVTTGGGTLILGGNITSNATAATARISGNVDLGGVARTVTVAPGTAVESLIIDANISNGGLTKAGTGALVLSGNNSYALPTTVSAGVLDVQSSTALGSTAQTTVAAGARVEIEGTGLSLGEPLTLNGGASLTTLGGSNTWAGNITVPGTATVNVGAGQLTLGGVISGAGGLTKAGPGTLLIDGTSNTFAGLTTVSAGTLGGTGNLGRVTVSAGAHLAPGAGGPGTLAAGNASFVTGASFDVDINGTAVGSGYDRLSAGSVALRGATLHVSLGSFTPLSGSRFTIIHGTNPDAGKTTFAGLADGATFTVGSTTFTITYVHIPGTGYDVVLTV